MTEAGSAGVAADLRRRLEPVKSGDRRSWLVALWVVVIAASLRFVPLAKLDEEGYGAYKARFASGASLPADHDNACARPAPGQAANCEATLETAILAGGCFWGMEDIIRQIPGVLETEVGYTGGTTSNPRYEDVKTGRTGHAEAVRVVFDPKKLSYEDLLENWFFLLILLLCIGMHVFGHGHGHGHGHGRGHGDHDPEKATPRPEPHRHDST